MSSKDAHLYGIPRPKTTNTSKNKPITSTNTLAFSTALSSLITAAKPSTSTPSLPLAISSSSSMLPTTAQGRTRPSKSKPDIFSTHNRNTSKRAAADMLAYEQESRNDMAKMDDQSWRRAKRKMEEKARLYSALKRGDVEDEGERYGVDFDRKWAERREKGEISGDEDDETDESDGEEEEQVEYTDEFGRTRTGTRADAARAQRQQNTGAAAVDESDRFTARPVQPKSGIIYGDTIQVDAFNPDEATTVMMEELAARRDRDLTPPEATHYDADWEIRTKGTGFFKFAKGEEERKTQMENLEKERVETERVRREREGGEDGVGVAGEVLVETEKERRKREIEERRKMIQQKRGKMQADKFLQELGGEIVGKGDRQGGDT